MSRERRGTGEQDERQRPLPAKRPGYREGTALPARRHPASDRVPVLWRSAATSFSCV